MIAESGKATDPIASVRPKEQGVFDVGKYLRGGAGSTRTCVNRVGRSNEEDICRWVSVYLAYDNLPGLLFVPPLADWLFQNEAGFCVTFCLRP